MSVEFSRNAIDVGVVTNNEPAMLSFYQGLLGFADAGEVTLPGFGVLKKLRFGESVLKLLIAERKAEIGATPSFAARSGFRYLAFEVRDLVGVVRQCRDMGCTILNDVMTLRPGVMAAMVADPDGNAVEFLEIEQN